MNENMILFPEYEELTQVIEKLRTEISMLVAQRDELVYVICKNIETAYMMEFGALEYRVYEAECVYLRLKRRLELIQMKINRQEIMNLQQIERILDEEFREYQHILEEKISAMNAAIEHSQCEVLSEEESKELKKLYRRIVKSLHPDFHSYLIESQKDLFNHAVEAYKNGNLATLRVIDAMVSDQKIEYHEKDSLSKLHDEKRRLEEVLNTVNDSISKIKEEYPYTLKELVENKEKGEQYQKDLHETLDSFSEASEMLITVINELMEEHR